MKDLKVPLKMPEVRMAVLQRQAKEKLKQESYLVAAMSSVISVIIIIMGFVLAGNNLALAFTFTFFGITVPVALFYYFRQKRVDNLEEQFPNFLRDIAEFKRSGMPLNQAIQSATKNDYGKLGVEVQKMAKELSWGFPFQQALVKFANRSNSKIINRAVSIIIVAQETGGEVTNVLETVSSDLRKLKEIEKERKSKLSVYTLTIYAIYMLLLFIIVMLMSSFVPAIPKIQAAGKFMGSGGSEDLITEFEFRTLLFHVSMIEAFFAGLISGDMGEGSVTAGIKHAVILVLIAMLAFQLVPASPGIDKIADAIMDIPPLKGSSTEGFEGMTHVDETFNTMQLAAKVREIAKERNMPMHKELTSESIEFIETPMECTACSEGRVSVEKDKLTVVEPTPIKFKTRFTGEKYVVEFYD
jgi:flagellar protein FlaJ